MVERPVDNAYSKFTPYVVNVRDINFSGSAFSLAAFPDWVWYTPAPAFLWGGLGDNILSDLQTSLELEYYQRSFDTLIFSGFEHKGSQHWNRTLWASPQADWNKLQKGLLEVTNVNAAESLMIKYGLQELTIYDPLAVEKANVITPEIPLVTIYGFGVMTNKSTIAFNPTQDVVERPRVYRQKPEAVMIDLGKKVLKASSEFGEVAEKMGGTTIEGAPYETYVRKRLDEEGR